MGIDLIDVALAFCIFMCDVDARAQTLSSFKISRKFHEKFTFIQKIETKKERKGRQIPYLMRAYVGKYSNNSLAHYLIARITKICNTNVIRYSSRISHNCN